MRRPPDLFNRLCPSRTIIDLIGSRWSMLIVCALRQGPVRANELIRRIDGISQKMFTHTVREMERSGLIHRQSYPEVPPRVEYSLTLLGDDLSTLVHQMEEWVVKNYDQIMDAKHSAQRQR
jgi:DNA-binding HxlR family transcriptional regulator